MIPGDAGAVVTGGSSVALGWLVYYLAKLFLDWRKTHNDTDQKTAEKRSNDSAWLIEELRASLKEEREDNQANSAEIAELRAQNSHLYQQMREQRSSYESEIRKLRSDYERTVAQLREQLQDLTTQVEAFQQRLRDEPPTP